MITNIRFSLLFCVAVYLFSNYDYQPDVFYVPATEISRSFDKLGLNCSGYNLTKIDPCVVLINPDTVPKLHGEISDLDTLNIEPSVVNALNIVMNDTIDSKKFLLNLIFQEYVNFIFHVYDNKVFAEQVFFNLMTYTHVDNVDIAHIMINNKLTVSNSNISIINIPENGLAHFKFNKTSTVLIKTNLTKVNTEYYRFYTPCDIIDSKKFKVIVKYYERR